MKRIMLILLLPALLSCDWLSGGGVKINRLGRTEGRFLPGHGLLVVRFPKRPIGVLSAKTYGGVVTRFPAHVEVPLERATWVYVDDYIGARVFLEKPTLTKSRRYAEVLIKVDPAALAGHYDIRFRDLPDETGLQPVKEIQKRLPGPRLLLERIGRGLLVDTRGAVWRSGSDEETWRYELLLAGHLNDTTLRKVKALRNEAATAELKIPESPKRWCPSHGCARYELFAYGITDADTSEFLLAQDGEVPKSRDSAAAKTLIAWFVALNRQTLPVTWGKLPFAYPRSQRP